MCLYPIPLKAKVTKVKGEGFTMGKITPARLVPCGHCYECLQSRRAQWSFRINQEYIEAKSAFFVTLTYNEENLPSELIKKDLQLFFKRLRLKDNVGKITYFACGEYGEKNHRPHYHAIIFNTLPKSIEQSWSVGFIKIGTVTKASIHYVTGYIMKNKTKLDDFTQVELKKESTGKQKEFAVMSKGIGLSYVSKASQYHITSETFDTHDKIHLSRYLKTKIFKNDELKRLKISAEVDKQIQEDLKAKGSGRFTAKAYYKAINNYHKNRKKL